MEISRATSRIVHVIFKNNLYHEGLYVLKKTQRRSWMFGSASFIRDGDDNESS